VNLFSIFINVIVLECQKEYWLEIIIGICVGVLVLGVTALIIWKQAVTIHDKREFARFQAEAQRAKWKTVRPLINHKFHLPVHHTKCVVSLVLKYLE